MNRHLVNYNLSSSNESGSKNDTPKSKLTSARAHLAHVQKILKDVKEHVAASEADVCRRKLYSHRSISPLSGGSMVRYTKPRLRHYRSWDAQKCETGRRNLDLRTLELEILRLRGDLQRNSAQAIKTREQEALLPFPGSEISSSPTSTPIMSRQRQSNRTNDVSSPIKKAPDNYSKKNRASLLRMDWLAQIRENRCHQFKYGDRNPRSESCKCNRCFGGKTTKWSNFEGPTSSTCCTRCPNETQMGETRHPLVMLKRSRSVETSAAPNMSNRNRKVSSTLVDSKKKMPIVLRRNKSTHELGATKKVTFMHDFGNGCLNASPYSSDLKTNHTDQALTHSEFGNYAVQESVPSRVEKEVQGFRRTLKYNNDGVIGAVQESIPSHVVVDVLDHKTHKITQAAPKPKGFRSTDDESVLSLFSITDPTTKNMSNTITIAESVNVKKKKNDSQKISKKSLDCPLSRRSAALGRSSPDQTANSMFRDHTISRRYSDITSDRARRNTAIRRRNSNVSESITYEASFTKLIEHGKNDSGWRD